MNTPDSPEHEPEFETEARLFVPNNLDGLQEFEQIESRRMFAGLYSELDRVELLGTDNSRRQSFHTIPTGWGERQVLFGCEIMQNYGRITQVIINDEVHDGENREMHISEFLVSRENTIACRNHYQSYDTGKRPGIPEDGSPLIWIVKDSVVVCRSDDAVLPSLPIRRPRDLIKLMDQKLLAEDLTTVLLYLSESSIDYIEQFPAPLRVERLEQ